MRIGVFPKKRLLEFYKSMILSRKTEQKIKELADAGEILGTHHESSGQEAIAVAIAAVKKPDDVLGLSVRTIANIVAVGGDLDRAQRHLEVRADFLRELRIRSSREYLQAVLHILTSLPHA